VVGELARWQGARTPGRVVSSAKAWLSHAGVDRQAPILPWGAPADVPKVSPVEASACLLDHLSESFRAAYPEHPLAESEVVPPEGAGLRRIAAGEHLLLGGDNMDAALAHAAERKLSRGRLAAGEWTQLVQVARAAKEALLGEDPPDRHTLPVAASGSRLVGG